ncbi:hypothetical protein CTA2_10035 [Colletotrichum tanaceti]|nr:hypothetical protein CTA2_10035 [Colletotrichum tanaceti]
MTVLTWLLEEYEPEELHRLGVGRRIVIRKGGAQSTHGTTEIAQISMDQIVQDSSLSSTHLVRLHRASLAAVRLLRNRIAGDIRDGLRRLLECLRWSSSKPPSLCGIKEEELIQSFPSVLTCIAEPLTHLEVIAGFLPRYHRSRHADEDGAKADDVRFFALAAPDNPAIRGRGRAMSRLTHCEMQVLDCYLLQSRPDNQLQGARRTRVGRFIGISKVCCPLCSIVMWTLTGVFAVDGSHDDLSVWWTLPLFLFCEDGLFREHRRCFFRVVAYWADKHGYQPGIAWQ